jgi:thiamine-phosphate pyrophosphorylase
MNEIAFQKSRLQFITNQWSPIPIEEQVERACRGGCSWIQLRFKDQDESKWPDLLTNVRSICQTYGAFLIINDHVEMALKSRADGVHVGKDDMCPDKARQLLGKQSIVGGTANTLEDILTLQSKGVDYIGLGPFRQTSTKQKLAPVLGIDGYEKIINRMKKENIALPVVAIGGITVQDIPRIMQTGVHGIALSSAIAHHPDAEAITRQIHELITQERHHAKDFR